MKKLNALSWTIETVDQTARVALKGEFSEASDFRPLLGVLPKVVTFDLGGIERVNSCGVREWVSFVGALEQAQTTLVLENCAVCVVGQLNLISNFRGNATVRSAFAPWYCPKCELHHERLIELGPGAVDALREAVACPKCGLPMDFEDLPDSYFEFLSYL